MAEFNPKFVDSFLGVVRKYMQIRGNLSQKDLAEQTEIGVSTMSRFLNQKTTELNPQVIARIVAKLNVPLHEIIDFVDEEFSEKFIKLVNFYKDEKSAAKFADTDATKTETKIEANAPVIERRGSGAEMSIRDKLETLSPRQKAYLSDFLDLDMEGRDLMVDLGNSLFRYFRQKGVNF